MRRKLLSLLLLALSAPAWGAYAYRATITVPAKCVGGGDCTSTTGTENESNFVVPVYASDTSLKTHGNGGQIYNTTTLLGETVPVDGIFTTDATCSSITGVNGWAFKSYSGTGGTFNAYVNATLLQYLSANVFYYCYGQSSDNTWHGGIQGAAFNSAASYFPFGNGTTLNTSDFSATANNLVAIWGATATTGSFDGAVQTTTSQDLRDTNSPTGLPTGAVNATACMVAYNSAILSWGVYAMGEGINFGTYQSANLLTLNWLVSYVSGFGISAKGSVPSDAWVPVCVTIASGTTVNFYINGAPDSGNPQTISALNVVNGGLNVGIDAQQNARYATQSSDNLIYGSVKSAGWIATWSNSMSQNSTFAAVSGIGPISGGAETVTLTPIIM